MEQYRRKWNEHIGRMSPDSIPKNIFRYQSKGKQVEKTSEMVEGLYFSVLITNKPNTGNDDDLETKGTYCCVTLQKIPTEGMMHLPRCYGPRVGYE
jgi:hypothetical protein